MCSRSVLQLSNSPPFFRYKYRGLRVLVAMFSGPAGAAADPEGTPVHHLQDEEEWWGGGLEVRRHGCRSPLSDSVHLIHHHCHHHCPPLRSPYYRPIVLAHPSQVLCPPCLHSPLSRARLWFRLWTALPSTCLIACGIQHWLLERLVMVCITLCINLFYFFNAYIRSSNNTDNFFIIIFLLRS